MFNPTTIFYSIEGTQRRLVPKYQFDVRIQNKDIFRVWVNAQTGEAVIIKSPNEFGYRICRDVSPTLGPMTCSDAGSDIIWYHNYGAVASRCAHRDPGNPDGVCKNADAQGPLHGTSAANDALDAIEQVNPVVCCSQIGGADRNVDIVYRTSGTSEPVAQYEPVSESIVSGVNSTALRSIEVVWHELGHHILYKTNPGIAALYDQPGQFFASAFIEAFGDLTDTGIAQMTTPTVALIDSYGDPWVHNDGHFAPAGTMRSLKDPTITSFYHMSNAYTYHDAGRAIGKYFFLIRENSGIAAPRFLELLLQVARNIADVDGNGLDLVDLKNSLLASVRPGETALLNAINSQFDAMYNNIPGVGGSSPPIGVPVQPGVPAPPFPVTVVFTGGCPILDGARVSEYRIDYPPVLGATTYRGFVQQINGPLTDSITTSSTYFFVQTNVPAQASVASCNSNNICGNSSVRVQVQMHPSCVNF